MTQEDVIKGLECLAKQHGIVGVCEPENCPYGDLHTCANEIARDALALLKAQEARVMTVEELKSCDRETIWFQVKSNHTMKQLTQDGIAALVFIGLLHNWNGYGTVWRCWTSRPTDAQREKEPWNG